MYIQIDYRRIIENIQTIRNRLEPGVKFCAVVKADAYGHGIRAVAKEIEQFVDYFGVARIGEGLLLREIGIRKPVLVLSASHNGDIGAALSSGLSLTVDDIAQLDCIESLCCAANKPAHIHIKADTGMNRLGIKSFDGFGRMCERIAKSPLMRCEGVYSHLATTVYTDRKFLEEQNGRFFEFAAAAKRFFPDVTCHLANTSSALSFPEGHHDMVRVGLGMFGYSDNPSVKLLPAKSVFAKVLETKHVKRGETVGYDRTYTAAQDTDIAVIDCGYGDGYCRNTAKNGKVLTDYGFCEILGNVCMDLTMIENPEARLKKGDNVILLGENLKKCLWANDIFQKCGTIIYETLCNLRKREQ